MPKLFVLIVAVFASLALSTMKGGVELTTKIDYFVYFVTGEKTDTLYDFDDTPKKPSNKWLYCMGILYDGLTALTAELCRIEPDGMHWASGWPVEDDQLHPVKSVVRGRHPLDFRVVKVRNSSIGRWAPVGRSFPNLMLTLSVHQLEEVANRKTKGVVTTISSRKIAAMMMLSLEECSEKYVELLKKYVNNTSTLANELPTSVFCAVEASEPFDPNAMPQARFRRGDDETPRPAAAATTNVPSGVHPSGGPARVANPGQHPTPSPIHTGPVPPGLSCPDSLGSPFIIAGGKVLGILVAADCHTVNVSFFQSIVDGLPVPEDYDLNEDSEHRTYWPLPPQPKTRRWTPKAPMVKGLTLRPVGWQGGAELRPFSVANSFASSFVLVSIGFICAWQTKNRLGSP